MDNYLRKVGTLFEPLPFHRCVLGFCNYQCELPLDFLHHLQNVHRDDPAFVSPCLFSTRCYHDTPFRSFSGLQKHLSRMHAAFFGRTQEIEGNYNGQNLNNGLAEDYGK